MFNLGKIIGKRFNLSEQGSRDLNRAIWACVLTNITSFFPFFIFLQIVNLIIEPITAGTDPEWWKVWAWFGGGVASAVLYFLANKFEYKKTYVASYAESEKNRVAVAERIRKLPMSFFFHKDLSELTTNMMADCTNIEHTLSHVLPELVANGISTVVICIFLAVFNWILALSIFCTLPIAFCIVFFSKRYQVKHIRKLREAQLETAAQTQEYIDGIKVIKAFGTGGKKFENMDNALKNMKKMQVKMEFGTGVLVSSASAILQMGTGITIFVGATMLTGGTLTFAVFLTFVLLATRIYAPILTILTLMAELFYFATTTKRMRTLAQEPVMGGEAREIKDFNIDFDNVSFAYNDDNVISNLSCRISENSVTAIVGPSGSGKSTIARLIARFFDAGEGSIKIGGVDVKTVEPEHLMQHMAFVFQDVVLFNDTVYNNIRIGNPDADEKAVFAAAREAQCDEFAAKLPDGYNSVIGENGCTLSGGERQRISIARALLKDAPIILLDEATAALDPENEVSIQSAISTLIQGKTVIVIAHRLRTVAGADNILVIDEGRLVESGTHDGLIANKGLYERLYTIQQESLGWSI